MDKRYATLMNPHLYSLGNIISCDSLKPSHLELCIPPSEQADTTVSGHFGPSEHSAFYGSLTGHETSTPFHAEVFHQPAHNYALSGTKHLIDSSCQSEQASLDGGFVCFASQKGIPCQFPHQQVSNLH
ncbi:hypothetical protein FGIG_07235 [Fasciola gigantica]|uniref:Uncharacterized protein n=1 Tax=Fasciola gigantica TaxID=46835 RepID=A0A504Z9U3_FASGI|nr:hypothetical protein FGIG_07235 [Fasciola gigantica]